MDANEHPTWIGWRIIDACVSSVIHFWGKKESLWSWNKVARSAVRIGIGPIQEEEKRNSTLCTIPESSTEIVAKG
jgi:hypothetical protein